MNNIRARIREFIWFFLRIIPLLNKIYETQNNQCKIRFNMFFIQKILGFNKKIYWPVHFSSKISSWKNIYCGIETCPGYMPGCYIQGTGGIYIGDYTQIAPNVGIISANHDLDDNRRHSSTKQVRIGKYGWIGMNSVILPGVELGDFTIVGAGSVVTKSFPKGYCVIAGNPAKFIKNLDKEKCIPYHSKNEYNGYIKNNLFEKFRNKNLKV